MKNFPTRDDFNVDFNFDCNFLGINISFLGVFVGKRFFFYQVTLLFFVRVEADFEINWLGFHLNCTKDYFKIR